MHPVVRKLESKVVHEGTGRIAKDEFGSVAFPICLSTTFVNRNLDQNQQFQYTRSDNPTRKQLEGCLAALEKSAFCCVFASGSAAMDAICEAAVAPSGCILASADLYGGSHRYLKHMQERGAFSVKYVDFTSTLQLEKALENAEQVSVVWIESCTNPLLRLVDFHSVAVRVKSKFPLAVVVVDNTFLTPFIVNPLEEQFEGAVDVVCHSVTKYLNGHCDVLMGAVCTNSPELHQKIRFFQNAIGNVPSPFDCFLTLRGIKTFALRMERQCENALKIAQFLSKHTNVTNVSYPGLATHPDWMSVGKKMLRNGLGGGMLAVQVRGKAVDFVKRLQVFLVAESLGGVESLVEIPSLMTHAGLTQEERETIGISDALVRISVGIEHVEDLICDLNQALE